MPHVARCLTTPLALALALAAPAAGDEPAPASDEALLYEDRIAELERTVQVLADELQRTRADIAVPEEPELVPRYGFGPAASKIYGVARGLSLGGYAEGFYTNFVNDQGSGINKSRDRADYLRLVLYAGYKFRENIVFNTEIEFEHATTSSTKTSGGGSVSVEFAALDFFWRDWLNFRTGLLLVPMGFLNQIHEPPYFYGVDRPDVERVIIPTTFRANGAGIFGSLGESIRYEAYVVNGFNAVGFDSGGLRGGRQKGNRTLAEHMALATKLEWTPWSPLTLGGSLFLGQAGQNQTLSDGMGSTVRIPDALTTLWEVHGQLEWKGLHLRSLFAMAHVDDAGDLTRALRMVPSGGGFELGAGEAVASTMFGTYGEVAYDIWRWIRPESERRLEPYYRYEFYDTQWDMPTGFGDDDAREIQVHTVGLQFKPVPNVVLKADYRNRQAASGQLADEVNLGVGVAF